MKLLVAYLHKQYFVSLDTALNICRMQGVGRGSHCEVSPAPASSLPCILVTKQSLVTVDARAAVLPASLFQERGPGVLGGGL